MWIKRIVLIVWGGIIMRIGMQAQDCEMVFVGNLKETYAPKVEKFQKKTRNICARQTTYVGTITVKDIVLIPRVCYKKSVKLKKRIGVGQYFCFVDPKTLHYDAALVLAKNDEIFSLASSPVKKGKYIVLPYGQSEIIRNLISMIREIEPEMVFTIPNTDHIFFIKGNRILIFDKEKGRIVEQEGTLSKIINDPLKFRYMSPGS